METAQRTRVWIPIIHVHAKGAWLLAYNSRLRKQRQEIPQSNLAMETDHSSKLWV